MGFRGYAQRDPLNEYKSEAYELFEVLLQTINEDVTKFMAFFQLVDSNKIQNENSNAENAEFSYNKKNEYNGKKSTKYSYRKLGQSWQKFSLSVRFRKKI